MTVLTRDEFALLLAKVAPFYQPLVLTLLATGLRFGEATVLTASDVDTSKQPASLRVTRRGAGRGLALLRRPAQDAARSAHRLAARGARRRAAAAAGGQAAR